MKNYLVTYLLKVFAEMCYWCWGNICLTTLCSYRFISVACKLIFSKAIPSHFDAIDTSIGLCISSLLQIVIVLSINSLSCWNKNYSQMAALRPKWNIQSRVVSREHWMMNISMHKISIMYKKSSVFYVKTGIEWLWISYGKCALS